MIRLIADEGDDALGLNFEQFQSLVTQISYWTKVPCLPPTTSSTPLFSTRCGPANHGHQIPHLAAKSCFWAGQSVRPHVWCCNCEGRLVTLFGAMVAGVLLSRLALRAAPTSCSEATNDPVSSCGSSTGIMAELKSVNQSERLPHRRPSAQSNLSKLWTHSANQMWCCDGFCLERLGMPREASAAKRSGGMRSWERSAKRIDEFVSRVSLIHHGQLRSRETATRSKDTVGHSTHLSVSMHLAPFVQNHATFLT